MSEAKQHFFLWEGTAQDIARDLRTGSGTQRREEEIDRERLQVHLGIDREGTSPSTDKVLGRLLVAYITTTTRLIGILERDLPEATDYTLHSTLSVPEGETPQQTFERLLEVAAHNSRHIPR